MLPGILIGSLGLFSACEKVIDIELRESDPRLVIEGVITDHTEKFRVKITTTKDYFDNSPSPVVNNASVYISDNIGNTDTLYYKDSGFYETPVPKQGVVGRKYQLTVKHEGKEYKASTSILPMNNMDSITQIYISEQSIFQDSGYYLMVHEKEYPAPGNYYRWIQYRNGVKQEDPIRYLMNDDKLLGNVPYIVAQLPYKYSYGDTAVVDQLSVSKEYYEYFLAVDMQLNRGGSPFDTPPGNPATNLSGGAIGYFFAVSLDRKTLIIK